MSSSPKSNNFQFPEVRVVEASAGSGKTYALAKRYVQLVLNPALPLEQIPLRHILAITFTNKAAFEMKSRILDFLKNMAFGQMPPHEEKEILGPLQIDRHQAQTKAFAAMEAIIRNYNFFQVQTIDKFINALLSGCAFKIGLTANFKIKTNALEYLEYSLDEVIDEAHRQKAVFKIFADFLHHYLYLENRTGWFPKEDILVIMHALYKQNNAYGYDFAVSSVHPEDLMKKKKEILKDMKSLRQLLPEGTDARFVKSFDEFLENNPAGFDVDGLSDYFARDALPLRKGIRAEPQLERLWTKIKDNIRRLCQEEAYSLFNPYIEIFAHVREQFLKLASKDDVLFLEELNRKAQALFDRDYVTVEELYYRLATRLRHYLIDEFQDTSRLQWCNLEKMAEEALSTGGSLFYVGDRKQAIYGFRGGDAGLFDDIKDRFAAFPVQVERLTKNWRSQKALVEFSNQVFAVENLRAFIGQVVSYRSGKNNRQAVVFTPEDVQNIIHVFGGAQQTSQETAEGGFVHLEYLDIDRKDERDAVIREKVITLLKALQKRFKNRELAILTRSNSEVEEMTSWLLKEGIPVESERTSNIKENILIQELLFFLRFLDSPIDNQAFTAFILGEVFTKASGLPSATLHQFAFSLRQRLSGERDFYVYTEFRGQFPSVWDEFIEEFFKNVGLYPLYELVVTIYHRFGVLKHFPYNQGYFMHFLELIKKKEEEHTDTASFLEYFEKLEGEDAYVQVSDSDAVKILTIHKAKGLEFPVVILPFLGLDVQVGSQGADYQPAYVLERDDSSLRLLRLKKAYRGFNEALNQIYALEYKKAFLSELNSIYVALTRAQYELYGLIPKKIGNSFNFVKFLIPETVYTKGQQISYEEKPSGAQDSVSLQIPPSAYHDWIDYLKDEFQSLEELKARRQILEGEIIHSVLSLIGNLSTADQERVVNNALEETQRRFSYPTDFTGYGALIRRLLKQEQLKPFFYCGEAHVLTEQEIVTAAGQTKRIDRLIVQGRQVWVVDYKTGAERHAEYEEQLKGYMTLVADVYPDYQIRGFLIYLDELRVEEVTSLSLRGVPTAP